MNYKSGIIFYKIKNNKYYFLLGNNNIFLSNKSKDLFNAVGYKDSINEKDEIINSFCESTLNGIFNKTELRNKKLISFYNKKYNYKLYFIKDDIDDKIINTLNKSISYLNSMLILDNNIFKKSLSIDNDFKENIKWFELIEIINNVQIFDKELINTLMKALKTNILN